MVAPWVPGPTRPRSLGFLKAISEEHDVWLVCQASDAEDAAHLSTLGLAGLTVLPRQRIRGLGRVARAMFSRRSLQIALLDSPEVRSEVRRLEATWLPDVFHFNVARSAGALAGVGETPVLFDLDEIRSDYYAQLSSTSTSLLRRLLGIVETPRLRRAERDIAERSNLVVFSSPSDLSRVAGSILVRSPHELHSDVDRGPVPGRILFVGRLGYSANREAIAWFAREVLPTLVASRPHVVLRIVGESPGDLQRLKSECVDVVGWVDDLVPEYAAAHVAVVPVSLGTGVQMKLIQALACGVPTVATTVCLERSGAPEGVAVAADSVEDWVDALVRLVDDPAASDLLGTEGHTWAAAAYGERGIKNALLDAYEQAERGSP